MERLQFLCELGEGTLGVADHGGFGRHRLVGGEELPPLQRLVDQEGEQQDGEDRQGDNVNNTGCSWR